VGNWSCFDAILIDYLLFKSDVIKNFAKFVRLWGWRQQKYTTHLYGRAKKAQIVFFIKKKPFLKNRKPKWQDKNFDCKIRSNSWFFFKKKKKWFCCIFRCGAENNNRKIRWRHSTDGSRDAAGWTIMFEVISHFSSNYKSKSSWLRSSCRVGELIARNFAGRILVFKKSQKISCRLHMYRWMTGGRLNRNSSPKKFRPSSVK